MSSPYDHPPTKQLRDELAHVDPALGSIVDLLLGPFTAGWVTLALWARNPRELLLWYLCDPAEVEVRCQSDEFHFDWNHGLPHFSQHGAGPGSTAVYHPAGTGAEVPLVYLRDYAEGSPAEWETIELAEDFRLFWNLYENRDRGEWLRSEHGRIEVIARRNGMVLEVRIQFLMRYLAARQLAAVGQLFADRFDDLAAPFGGRDDHVREPLHSLHVSDRTYKGSAPTLWVFAKRGVLPEPIETCGVWPYDDDSCPGEMFVVGHDERGAVVQLPADRDSPDFLRAVHFERGVLEPYYGDPTRYTVKDGLVFGPTWVLPIDNDHGDRVIAYLGDLGKLPEFEQKR